MAEQILAPAAGQIAKLLGGPAFVDNKYRRWYCALIAAAMGRVREGGCEKHHVLPKSLGGLDSCRVALTYREHYVAHWLLTKFTVGQARQKMCHAMWALARQRNGGLVMTSAQYERARVAHRSALVGNKFAAGVVKTTTQIEAHRQALTGRPKTQAHKDKIGRSTKGNKGSRGLKLSAETRLKMSKPKSAQTKAKMSASLMGNKRMLGHRHTPESIEKMRIARWGAKDDDPVRGF